jgi:Calcineurin-like phosphoesterase
MRRRIVLAAVTCLAIAGAFYTTSGSPPPTPTRPGTFVFAVLGDAPYYIWEDIKYRLVLKDLDAHDLQWVLHVGDIFWRPCTDGRYARSLGEFNSLRHPVIYTPGDNEWTDCWEPGSGGFAPRERLGRLRQIFFAEPTRSLGARRLPLLSEASHPPFAEFVENARWTHAGIIFATVHLVGSRNGMRGFAARTTADDEAAKRRTEAATAWLRETFAEARSVNASAVVIGFHGNPAFEERPGDPDREVFEPFIAALEEEVALFDGPVLVVHGDDHIYTVDRPLIRRTTGKRLEHFTRLQVPGSPQVGWVRVVVTHGATAPFSFEARVVPRWKYW